MTEKEEEEANKTSLNVFIRGSFSEKLEKKLLQNWNVVPLRIFDECRKRGVEFIDAHKKGISIGEQTRRFLTRRGGFTLTLHLGTVFGATVEEEKPAHIVHFETEDVTTGLAMGDKFDFEVRKPKIMFVVESLDFTELDQIATYKEKLVADLAVVFSAVQQVASQEEIEIWIDTISMLLRLPKESKFKEGLDIGPLARWSQNTFGIPSKEAKSIALGRCNLNWERNGVKHFVGVSGRSIQLDTSNLSMKGDVIDIAEELVSMISDQFSTIQNIRQAAIEG